ncbi:hypothetical protein ACW7BJ_16250 [Azospirillum argentinense]
MANETLPERLDRLITERGTNPRAASIAAGLNPTAARDIIDGKSKRPLHTTIAAFARVLGVDADYLACRTDAAGEVAPQQEERPRPSSAPDALLFERAMELATEDEQRILKELAERIIERGKKKRRASGGK